MYHGFIGPHFPDHVYLGSQDFKVTCFMYHVFPEPCMSVTKHALDYIPASHLELRSPAGLLGAGPAQRVDVGHQLIHVKDLPPVLEGAAEVPGAPVLEWVEVPGAPVHGSREDVIAETDVCGPAHLGSDLHHRLLQAAQRERQRKN
jgi:hypothetical protein